MINVLPIVLSSVILTALVISIIRILRYPRTKFQHAVLICLRSFFSILAIIAFFEPAIQFERLPHLSRTIPVLIDNSRSMSLFSPDSSILPCIKTISYVNHHLSEGDQRFEFYSFGDTLKKVSPDQYSFTESESNFPAVAGNEDIDKAHSLIIISDANWTNSVTLSKFADNKSIYYLELPNPHPAPSIDLEVSDPEHSLKNSSTIRYRINGFIHDTSVLTVKCVSAGNTLLQKTVNRATGHLQDTFSVDLPEMKPGLHVMRFQVLLHDSLVAEHRHLQQIARETFYYRTQFLTPSIDNRFLLLAFSSDSSFSLAANVSPDVLIITGYSSEKAGKISPISENGLLFFAGSLPCTVRKQSMTKTLIADFSNYSGFNRIETPSLPSIPVIHNCLQTSISRIYAWVSSINGTRIDTLPALYTSVFSNKKALFLSLNNIWRWDFAPLISDHGEEQAFSFSRRIVEAVKEILVSNISSTYVSFVNNNVNSSVPLTFEHHIPQNFDFNEQVTIRCTVKDKSGTLLDSTIITNVNGSGKIHTSFNPLPEGKYIYNTSLTGKKRTYSFSDSVFIRSDNREYLVNGQNEYIFTDIAQPIRSADSVFFSTMLKGVSSASIVPVKDTFTLSRNWILLSLILIIYGTELFLRRYWNLDKY